MGFTKLWEDGSYGSGLRGSRSERGRWRWRSPRPRTNLERPNGSYNESLLKLAEHRCGGLVDQPLWSTEGLDELGRIRARVRITFENLPECFGLVLACDEKDDGPRRVYDGDG